MDATPTPTSALSQIGSTALVTGEIEKALALACGSNVSVEAVSITGSTNGDLVLRARVQQPSVCVVRAADFQTGGRGRQERVWRAAPGDALLFSVAIPIAGVPQSLPAVTLACGVALAESLAGDGLAVQLKWPNDVRVNRSKLAGILTELVVDRDVRYTLVIGVGMNLRLDEAARRAIEQPAIALDQLLPATIGRRRERWLGQLGGAMITAAAEFVRNGFDPFCSRFNSLLEARGELVDVVDGNQRMISGRVVEVDRFGRLVIESGGVSRSISVGDVSVRAFNQ